MRIEYGLTIIDLGRVLTIVILSIKTLKKTFMKALKAVRKAFENDQILEVIHASKLDRKKFWKILQKARGGISNRASAVRGRDGKVVIEIEDILDVWKGHFENLGIPKQSPYFADDHYVRVMSFIEDYSKAQSDDDNFLSIPFTRDEVSKAITNL